MSRVVIKALEEKVGEPLNIAYGFAETPLNGEVVLAWLSDKASNSICHLHFVQKTRNSCVVELQSRWPKATLTENTKSAQQLAKRIFEETAANKNDDTFEVSVVGTAFQQSVWEALLQIPAGSSSTYGDIAKQIGKPNTALAVGNAVGRNEVAVLIPCHRVVSKAGNKFKYRWGVENKRKLLEQEKTETTKKNNTKKENKISPNKK